MTVGFKMRASALGVFSLFLLAMALALSACGTTSATHVETVEVKIPVAIQPIRPDQVPRPPAPLGKRPPTLQQAADAALAKVCEWVAYGLRADPLLHISAGEAPGAALDYPECRKR